MSYGPPGEPQDPQDPHQPQPPYGQPPSDPTNPYGQYGQHNQPGQYPQPGQYGQPGGPGQPPSTNTNVLAILSLVFAFVFAPAGIVLGHLAKKQIKQNREPGEQLATWGLVLSYIFTGLYLAGCCAWIGVVLWAGSNGGNTY